MDKKGFSLMEIMIVVVVVGILAALAIPAYTGYVTRTRRADAITALETVALYEEKNFAQSNKYDTLANLIANQGLSDPNAAANRNYNIAVTTGGGGTTFVATATPINAQANDKVNGNLLIFAIDNNGNRGTSNGGGGVAANINLWNSLRP
jgi:type IV pilus assembly protein PilE